MKTKFSATFFGVLYFVAICHGADGLDSWTLRTNSLPATNWLYGIAYGNERFVAVGGSPSQINSGMGVIVTSSDGTNWVQESVVPETLALLGVTYGANQFVSVGKNSTLSSLSGTNWIAANVESAPRNSVAFGNGLFVATGIGFGSRDGFSVSTDGLTWTITSYGTAFGLYGGRSIAFGQGRFVAVGSPTVNTSTNGTNWIAVPPKGWLFDDLTLNGVAFGTGLFIAVGKYGVNSGAILTSTDSTSWNQIRSIGTPPNLLSAAYGNGTFVVVGQGGTILTSSDGVVWTTRTSGTSNDLTAVTYGNGHFMAVGANGTILESGPVIRLSSLVTASNSPVQFTLSGPVGQFCQIQTSRDLTNWNELTDLTLVEPSTTFVIVSPTNSSQTFYRAVVP